MTVESYENTHEICPQCKKGILTRGSVHDSSKKTGVSIPTKECTCGYRVEDDSHKEK